jgi:hypothetical protein
MVVAAPLAVALALTAGCSASPAGAADVAQRFVRAVADHDGKAACALLLPAAAQAAGGAAKVPCARAVLHLDEQQAAVTSSEVWGDAAIVHLGSETVFLRRLPAGWRVSAAGCTYEPNAPYDCDVEA